jgi:hypothetical protein
MLRVLLRIHALTFSWEPELNGAIGPHAMQNYSELARYGDDCSAVAARLGQTYPPSLPCGPLVVSRE